MIIFESLLTTFEVIPIIQGSWGSIKISPSFKSNCEIGTSQLERSLGKRQCSLAVLALNCN